MGTWRTYIAPLRNDEEFGEYQEVTQYTVDNNVGTIRVKTESNDYDIGIAPNENISLNFNNQDGIFNEPSAPSSMFTYRRGGSKVKLTYLFGQYEPICGLAVAGQDVLGPEIHVFEGLLQERDAAQNVIQDTIKFSVLGKSSIFSEIEADISVLSADDTIAEAIVKVTNVMEVNRIINVDLANINPTLNPKLSDINSDLTLSYLENYTLKELLDEFMLATSSILYVNGSDLIVSNRTPSAEVEYNFYGQASPLGIENIQNIDNFKDGFNRLFNFWKWDDTDLVAKDTSSISDYGVYKHDDLDFKIVTDLAYRQLLLNQYRDEFGRPEVELDLSTYVNVEVLGLALNDKVNIDYPNVPIAGGTGIVPIWNTGNMIWQEEDTFDPNKPYFVWPDALFNIEIGQDREFKIIGYEINSKNDEIKYNLREI